MYFEMTIRLDEDWHVHSTFSDGSDTVAANIDAAVARRLRRLGCVELVCRDSKYVGAYAAAVARARPSLPFEVTIGVEAKLLNSEGVLDLPCDLGGIDLVYIADHEYPGHRGPIPPHLVRSAIAAGHCTPDDVVADLVNATITAVRVNGAHRLVLAHLFSILPKLGLDERSVSDDALHAVADCAATTGTMLEVSERWHCPSARMIRVCEMHGVPIIAGSDSRHACDVGSYHFVRDVAAIEL